MSWRMPNEYVKKSMTRSAMYPVNHLGEPCRQAHATLDGWHWVFKLFHKALNLILYQNLFDSAVTRFTAAQTKLSGRAGAIVKSGGSGSNWSWSPFIFQNFLEPECSARGTLASTRSPSGHIWVALSLPKPTWGDACVSFNCSLHRHHPDWWGICQTIHKYHLGVLVCQNVVIPRVGTDQTTKVS